MKKPRAALLPPRVWHSTWGQEKNLVNHLARVFRIDVLDLMDFGGRHQKAGPNRFPPPEGVRVIERPTPPHLVLQGVYLELANFFRILFGPYQLLITYLTMGGVLATLAAKLRGAKVLLIYADDYVEFYRQKNSLAGALTKALANPLVARLADRAVATAELLAEDLKPFNPAVVRVPNGVEAAKLAGVPTKTEGPFTVGFVGGFGHWVDFEAVVEAAGLLPEVEFILVGGGDRYQEVREMAHGLANLTLTGQVDYDRVLAELAGMDVCLIPFKRSGLTDRVSPIKLFEYWAAGRPVITSPIREVRLTAENDSASYYWPGLGESLAQAIIELKEQPELGERLVAAGRKRLVAHDWSNLIRQYREMLAEMGFEVGS